MDKEGVLRQNVGPGTLARKDTINFLPLRNFPAEHGSISRLAGRIRRGYSGSLGQRH